MSASVVFVALDRTAGPSSSPSGSDQTSQLPTAGARPGSTALCINLGLALGGRPTANFARRLMVPAGRDTMLRTVRRRTVRPVEHPRVIGINAGIKHPVVRV